MSHQGYIKLYRKMMHSPIWQDPYYLKIWMYCLMKASHKEHHQLVGNKMVKLNPGEFITGRQSLSDDLNKGMKRNQKLSERTWYRYLENLENWEMLTIRKTNKYSVVSITKWSDYQESDHQLTNKSPTVDHQLTTNKNDKNVKNDKKKDYDSKIKDLLSLYSSKINDFAKLNKRYWDVIRETRKTGKVSKSVIHRNMEMWKRFDPVVVEYGLKEHMNNHAGKKEEYTLGIMRNTSKEEAEQRLLFPPKRKGEVNLNDFNLDDEETGSGIIEFLK